MRCGADTCKDVHVLCDGVAIFLGIGEHTAKECNGRQDKLSVSITVNIVVSLGAWAQKLAQAEGECWFARGVIPITLLHMCFPCHKTAVHT